MEAWNHKDAVLFWEKTAEGGGRVVAIGREDENLFPPAQDPYACTTMYGEPGFHAWAGGIYRNIKNDNAETVEFSDGVLKLVYQKDSLRVTVRIEGEPNAACFRQRVSVENVGEAPVALTTLTSASLPVFGFEGDPDPENWELSFCKQTWYGEGQWMEQSFADVGIFCNSRNTPFTSNFSISSMGAQTTAKFFPLILIRDRKRNQTFFCELEPLNSWQMEVGFRRVWQQTRGCVSLSCGCAEDRNLRFVHTLAPGGRYETVACAYGVVQGGRENALKELVKMRRARHKLLPDTPLVFYNDYLNALWANPTEEACLNLARNAKKAGADVFIMDAGWFCSLGILWDNKLGDWKTDSNRFPSGLKGFLSKVKDLGLRVGVWLEMEVCGVAADNHHMPESWFVTRNGKRIGSAERRFFDFTNPEVKAFYSKKIDELVSLGVSVIKNDFNDSYYACGDEETYGAQERQSAFFEFIDSIIAAHSGLIIESCSSGGMREDGNALSHFQFQSVSDQDDYRLYPSIIKGSLMNILPEQLGIWAMPYPAAAGQPLTPKDERFKDGEQTAFNLVSGLAGVMYLSGRIDYCDDKNFGIIRSAVSLAKEIYPFIRNSYPQYPLGMSRLTERNRDALILSDEAEEEKLLYVWRLEGESSFEIPLGGAYEAELIFPTDLPCRYEIKGENLSVELPKQYSARLFRLRKTI